MIAVSLMTSSKKQCFIPNSFSWLALYPSFKIIPIDSIFDALSLLKRLPISTGQWQEG